MNETLPQRIPSDPVELEDQSGLTVQNAADTVAQAATGAAYGGTLGAPGGPAALVVGAVAGALAAMRPASPDEEVVEDAVE